LSKISKKMGKTPVAKRVYTFSDSTLVQTTDDVGHSLTRDLADLGFYGVTAGVITALGALRTTFYGVQGDVFYVAQITGAANNKNTVRDSLETDLRALEAGTGGTLGAADSRTLSLGIRGLSALADKDLVDVAKNAHLAALTFVAELAATDIDAAWLEALRLKIVDFDAKLDLIRVAIKNRDMAATDRVKKGNALYKELVRLAGFGKDYYFSRDESKYNDYIIVDTKNAGGNTQERTIANNEKVNFDFNSIEETDTFSITGDPNKEGELYMSDTLTGDPTGPVITINPGETITKTALELGWDPLKVFLVGRNNAQGVDIVIKVVREG